MKLFRASKSSRSLRRRLLHIMVRIREGVYVGWGMGVGSNGSGSGVVSRGGVGGGGSASTFGEGFESRFLERVIYVGLYAEGEIFIDPGLFMEGVEGTGACVGG